MLLVESCVPLMHTCNALHQTQVDLNTGVPVMFTSDHVRELQPDNWIEQVVGSGTYGSVCKASWRGADVAVKVIKLPGWSSLELFEWLHSC